MKELNKESTYSLINKLKSHTKSTTQELQNKFLPVLYTGKIFKTKQYHYLDRWFTYAASVDEPEKTFGIIQVENLPYRNIGYKESKYSFCYPLTKMIYNKYIMPIMLFINNKFVPWDNIEVIHDSSISYLKIYGELYTYDSIRTIQMYTLPYNISYLGVENDYMFNNSFEALSEYINKNATLVNDITYARLPDISTEYNYNNHTYSIGYWAYKQIILKEMKLLSNDRIDKLRAIKITKNIVNERNEVVKSYITTINIFDRDSYIEGVKEQLKTSILGTKLFSFDKNNLLTENGVYNLYLIDSNEINIVKKSFNNDYYYDIDKVHHNNLTRDNFIIFKNGRICTDYKLSIGENNCYKIYDINKTQNINDNGSIGSTTTDNSCKVFIFYNEDVENTLFHRDSFVNKEYMYSIANNKFKDSNDIGYIDELNEPLEFEISSKKTYEDNFSNAFNTVLEYNPLLFNSIYDRSIVTKTMSGSDVNKLFTSFLRNKGIKIPRMTYENHETYAMVFVNGELIEEYSTMITTSNLLFIKRDKKFNSSDVIELVYFVNVNNNEIPFIYKGGDIFDSIIPREDLKLFSTDVKDILKYQDITFDDNEISFPVYSKENGDVELIDNVLNNRKMVAVSSKKFIYERLEVDQKAYRIRLSKRFKYCDNQKQYKLFINGRKVEDSYYLITIPKISRPFDAMYLYTSQFVDPTDRIELFYLPEEYENINSDYSITLQQNGYIECNKTILNFPFSKENFIFFINGKKIPFDDIINVSTNVVRIKTDPQTTANLQIIPINRNYISNVSEFLKNENKLSNFEYLIDYILENNNLGYNEMDKLFNVYIKMSNIESVIGADVARIAIINEIVRDFWVTSGFDYNIRPFIYDYELDDFITTDENGNYIIPALDALPEININKDDLHTVYFQFMNDMPEYFEYGYKISNPLLSWEYNGSYSNNIIESQSINGESLDVNIRQYQVSKIISTDESYVLKASNGFNTCSSTIDIKFANGIYYGLVDEDTLDNRASDIYHANPTRLLRDITKVIQPTVELSLTDYVIGNNKYFIYAAPERLVYDENGKFKISVYLPDINLSDYMDDKTAPILTNGEYDSENNLFIGLDKLGIEVMTRFSYTNIYGYTENYVILKTTGYFTRNLENAKFNIYVR